MKKDKRPRVTILEGGGLLVPDTVELVDQRANRGENYVPSSVLSQYELDRMPTITCRCGRSIAFKPVPRQVTDFEDLKKGQWVAWRAAQINLTGTVRKYRAYAGVLTSYWDSKDPGDRRWQVEALEGSDETGHYLFPHDVNQGEVVLLQDAPAAPVTVQRARAEYFRDWWSQYRLDHDGIFAVDDFVDNVLTPALIDNADTGDDR